MLINQNVKTPIGEGKCQGEFDGSILSLGDSAAVLVRLPVNDATRDYLKQSNCLTPRATQTGLWVFLKEDLS